MTIAKRLLLALAIIMTAPIAAQAKDAPPTKSYDTVVLWAVGMERKHQRKIEESVVKILAKKGVTGIAMVDLTEDGKGYTQAQILELLVQSGAQAIFEVADAGPEGLKQIRSHATQDIIQGGKGKSATTAINVGSARAGGSKVMMGMGGDNMRQKPHRYFVAYLVDVETAQRTNNEKLRITAKEGSKIRVFAGKAFRKAAKHALKKGYLAAAVDQ